MVDLEKGVVFFNVLELSLVSLSHFVLLLALTLAQLVDTAGGNSLRKHSLMEERWRRDWRVGGRWGKGGMEKERERKRKRRERGRGREGGEWKVKERAGDRWEKGREIEPTCTHTYIPGASTPTSSAFTPRAHVHVVCRPAVTQEAPSRNLQIKNQLGSISRQHARKTRCALMVVAVETVGRVRNFLKSYQLRGSGEI